MNLLKALSIILSIRLASAVLGKLVWDFHYAEADGVWAETGGWGVLIATFTGGGVIGGALGALVARRVVEGAARGPLFTLFLLIEAPFVLPRMLELQTQWPLSTIGAIVGVALVLWGAGLIHGARETG